MQAKLKGPLVAVVIGIAIIVGMGLIQKYVPVQIDSNSIALTCVIGGITTVAGLMKFWKENSGGSSLTLRFRLR
ncbi:MAG: hypothetical protein ACRD94_01805 [Nitrosopumilaceae archaeon]